jgi:hypothetical protein
MIGSQTHRVGRSGDVDRAAVRHEVIAPVLSRMLKPGELQTINLAR